MLRVAIRYEIQVTDKLIVTLLIKFVRSVGRVNLRFEMHTKQQFINSLLDLKILFE